MKMLPVNNGVADGEAIELEDKKRVIEAIQKRYQHATLAKKTAILDKFIEVTGYHRKHAVRLLGPNGERKEKKPQPKVRIYGEVFKQH